MSKSKPPFDAKKLAETIIHVIKEPLQILADRVTKLENQGFAYRGVWQAAIDYQRGMFVTFEGSMWHCNADSTRAKPGTGSDWTLAVKGTR